MFLFVPQVIGVSLRVLPKTQPAIGDIRSAFVWPYGLILEFLGNVPPFRLEREDGEKQKNGWTIILWFSKLAERDKDAY